jgi:hypothetical protein
VLRNFSSSSGHLTWSAPTSLDVRPSRPGTEAELDDGPDEPAIPATLGEEEDVSDPSVEMGKGLSVERAREWACDPKLNPLWDAELMGGDGMGTAPVAAKGEDGRWTYEGRLPDGVDDGVFSNPIDDTEFRRFLSAAKAEDCGRSISSP